MKTELDHKRTTYLFGLCTIEYKVLDTAPQLLNYVGIDRYMHHIKVSIFWGLFQYYWNIGSTDTQWNLCTNTVGIVNKWWKR